MFFERDMHIWAETRFNIRYDKRLSYFGYASYVLVSLFVFQPDYRVKPGG
jgi:hypothetical protein